MGRSTYSENLSSKQVEPASAADVILAQSSQINPPELKLQRKRLLHRPLFIKLYTVSTWSTLRPQPKTLRKDMDFIVQYSVQYMTGLCTYVTYSIYFIWQYLVSSMVLTFDHLLFRPPIFLSEIFFGSFYGVFAGSSKQQGKVLKFPQTQHKESRYDWLSNVLHNNDSAFTKSKVNHRWLWVWTVHPFSFESTLQASLQYISLIDL